MTPRLYQTAAVFVLIFSAAAFGQAPPPGSPPAGQGNAAPSPDNGPHAAANKELTLKFFKMAFTDHMVAEAFRLYVSDDFIEHSPGMKGRAGAIESLSKMFAPGKGLTVVARGSVAQGDLVTVHFDNGVDIFRVRNGKIVEHWDG